MDIFDTLAQGDLGAVKDAIAANPSLATSRNPSGASLLAWAYYTGKPEAVPLIRPHVEKLDPYDAIIVDDIEAVKDALANGWDGNALSPDGFTPLGLAAFFNRPAIFDLLLPLTRDVNEPAQNTQKVAALHAATAMRNADMVEKLLRAGARPDQRQAAGFTPLHSAAHHGDAVIAGLLLLAGADRTLTSDDGLDAAGHARANGHAWLADQLARG